LLAARAALTLACIIADLAGAEMIAAPRLDEALQFRPSVEAG
jgi:predicted ATPase with chaperone activity